MKFIDRTWLIAILAACLLSACVSQPSAPSSPKKSEPPEFRSVVAQNGEGVPNGRSDSAMPYYRGAMEKSDDSQYGYVKEKPVKVGPFTSWQHILYLNFSTISLIG